jgi:hypothetical protein
MPAVEAAQREGLGVTESRNAARSAGLAFSNDSWSRLWRVTSELEAIRGRERDAPIERRPGGDRIIRGDFRFQGQYAQRAVVTLVDRFTGEVLPLRYTAVTNTLLTRQGIIDAAIAAYGSVAASLAADIVDATYDSTLARE